MFAEGGTTVKRLEQLPEITDRALAGIQADAQLKYRILHAAEDLQKKPVRRKLPRAALAGLCAAALLLAAGLPLALRPAQEQTSLVTSFMAGEATREPELAAKAGIQGGNLTAGQGGGSGLWEGGSDYPLIGMNGRYYRLLSEPRGRKLAGGSMGKIAEFSTEPALAGGTVVSNVCAVGTEVFGVSGMGNAAVTAQLNGEWRVFQRVSYNGAALRGSESLADTLGIRGHVTSLSLSGSGTVTGPEAARLADLLLSSASYEGGGQLSGGERLIISLDNGLSLQMNAGNDRLSACGVWVCPEFFEAFAAVR